MIHNILVVIILDNKKISFQINEWHLIVICVFLYNHVIWIINVQEKGGWSYVSFRRILPGWSAQRLKDAKRSNWITHGISSIFFNTSKAAFHKNKEDKLKCSPNAVCFYFRHDIHLWRCLGQPVLVVFWFSWMTGQMQVCHVRIFPALLQWSLKAEKCSTI